MVFIHIPKKFCAIFMLLMNQSLFALFQYTWKAKKYSTTRKIVT